MAHQLNTVSDCGREQEHIEPPEIALAADFALDAQHSTIYTSGFKSIVAPPASAPPEFSRPGIHKCCCCCTVAAAVLELSTGISERRLSLCVCVCVRPHVGVDVRPIEYTSGKREKLHAHTSQNHHPPPEDHPLVDSAGSSGSDEWLLSHRCTSALHSVRREWQWPNTTGPISPASFRQPTLRARAIEI